MNEQTVYALQASARTAVDVAVSLDGGEMRSVFQPASAGVLILRPGDTLKLVVIPREETALDVSVFAESSHFHDCRPARILSPRLGPD